MRIEKSVLRNWFVLALLLALSLITMFALKNVDRFYVVNEQLLADPQFIQGDRSWEQSGSEKVYFVGETMSVVTSPGASHSIFQNVSIETPAQIRFSFNGSSKNVVPGIEEWERASATIIYRDHTGERVGSHMSTVLEGTTPKMEYVYMEQLREHLGSIDIVFRILHASGEFSVSNPVLSVLDEFPFYKNMKLVIVAFWILALIWLSVIAFRVMNRGLIAVILLLILAVGVGTLMPQHVMVAVNQKLAALAPPALLDGTRFLLQKIFGIDDLVGVGAEISKLGHFAGFVLIGLVASCVCQRLGTVFTVAAIALFAFLTESLQLLVGGRSPRISDFALDVSGGVIGLLVGICCLYIYGTVKGIFVKPVSDEPASEEA